MPLGALSFVSALFFLRPYRSLESAGPADLLPPPCFWSDIADFLLQTLAVILGVTLLARAYMTYLGMPARNPLAQFSIALTDWIVRPLRRLVPGAGRSTAATLLAALLVALACCSP